MSSLSEIISNIPEYPSPQEEWEKCKLLLDTIEKSNALKLLEGLKQTIESNPTLNQKRGVGLDTYVATINKEDVERLSKSDPHTIGEVKVLLPRKNSDSQKIIVPNAFLELVYNKDTFFYQRLSYYGRVVEGRDDFYNTPRHADESLIVKCEEPGALVLMRCKDTAGNLSFSEREIVQNATSPEGQKSVDVILGNLYSRYPAKLQS